MAPCNSLKPRVRCSKASGRYSYGDRSSVNLPSHPGRARLLGDLSAADAALFQILRQWRADTAREQGVPAYVILHDKTLRELAETRPVSHGLLAGITGMGSAKIEHYGQELLTLIREHAA